RDRLWAPEHVDRDGGLPGAHGEVVADRQHRVVGLPQVPDELHVAEDARVAREVDRPPLLEADHEAARLARVGAVGSARGMEGVDERVGDAVELERAAFVQPRKLADVRALTRQPRLQLDLRDHVRVRESLRERDGVADVVAVTVRDADHVDALRLLLVGGRLGVVGEERVDVDPLPAVAAEHERSVAEPGETSQTALLSSRARGVYEGSSDRGAKLWTRGTA